MDLFTPIEKLPKVGSFYAARLKKLKIRTLNDLLHHYPFRYEDLGTPKKISEIVPGNIVSTKGVVWKIGNTKTRFGKILTFATINDGNASIETVWFNQPYLTTSIRQGSKLALAGKVGTFSHRPTFINPEFEIIHSSSKRNIHTEGLVSIYPETARLSSKWLRKKIGELLPTVLPKVEETLPVILLKRHNLISRREALWQIHFPKKSKQIEEAKRRLAFDEILTAILKALERKASWGKIVKKVGLDVPQEKILSFIASLPFELTNAQRTVVKEILADFTKPTAMNRLLAGDVGSGKTVVAAIAAYAVYLNGWQVTFMAPTEILAIQHFNTIKTLLSPLGIKVSLRTSSRKMPDPFDVIVGTHALLSKNVTFNRLGLVVIDEQHRFGVKQRALLRVKGVSPHVLTMTATPIPRSLALTLYGDLDVSNLDELPKGRRQVKTYVVPPEKRTKAYWFIKNHILEGRQAFIICPLIEPSETLATAKAAVEEYERLKKEIFPDLSLGLLHGKMKSADKEGVLADFKARKLAILVSTPVVEVGIDVPNAVVMMVEASERFGLASLHQLRGRVGRGAEQSFCLLFTESASKAVINRLSAMEKHHAGLALAEIDLKMRGPGQIYGTAQSGVPNFKLANLLDLPLVSAAKKEAVFLFESYGLNKLPSLKKQLDEQSLIPPD